MSEGGFGIGQSAACVFMRKTKCLMRSVHGDDFATLESKKDLDWFTKEREKKYEFIEGPRVDSGPKDDKEGRILNRAFQWSAEGLT